VTIKVNALNLMIHLNYKLDRKSIEIIYNSFLLPIMEYANVVWGGTYESDMLKLEIIHIDGMRLVTGATAQSNIVNLYSDTCWLSIHGICNNAMLTMMYKIKDNTAPEYIWQICSFQ